MVTIDARLLGHPGSSGHVSSAGRLVHPPTFAEGQARWGEGLRTAGPVRSGTGTMQLKLGVSSTASFTDAQGVAVRTTVTPARSTRHTLSLTTPSRTPSVTAQGEGGGSGRTPHLIPPAPTPGVSKHAHTVSATTPRTSSSSSSSSTRSGQAALAGLAGAGPGGPGGLMNGTPSTHPTTGGRRGGGSVGGGGGPSSAYARALADTGLGLGLRLDSHSTSTLIQPSSSSSSSPAYTVTPPPATGTGAGGHTGAPTPPGAGAGAGASSPFSRASDLRRRASSGSSSGAPSGGGVVQAVQGGPEAELSSGGGVQAQGEVQTAQVWMQA